MQTVAALLRRVGQPLEIVSLELAPPRANEVLVRMEAAGVCHSDWHIMNGATRHPLPVVLGHEGCGRVIEVGPGVTHVAPGHPVVLNWAPYCGECFYCRQGEFVLCETYKKAIWAGTLMNGGTRFSFEGKPVYQYTALGCFSQYVVVPATSCVPLPFEMPPAPAALIGCAVATGAGAVFHSALGVDEGSEERSAAIFGCGGVGLSCIMAAAALGVKPIIAVDRTWERAQAALEFGATDAVLASDDAAATIARVQELTAGRGADFVFEAVGHPKVQETAFHAARPGGTVYLVGLAPMGTETNIPGALITRQAKTIVGSYYGSANVALDFPKYAEDYRQGKLPIQRLVKRTYKLDQINEAFDDLIHGGPGRGVIVWE